MKSACLDEDGAIHYPPQKAKSSSSGAPAEASNTSRKKVFVDGIESEILYTAGKDGLWPLNVRIPALASKGEVVWRAGERESVEGVYVALQE